MDTSRIPEGDPLARLDALYERSILQQNWQQAVQVRAQAATLSQLRGRTDLFRRYFQEAIDLACKYKLQRLELGQRILRFSCLLNSDLTGQILDQLGAEIKCEFLPTGAADLKGALVAQLEQYSFSALAAHDSLLHRESQLPDTLKVLLRTASEKAVAFSLTYLAAQFDDALDLLNKDETAAVRLNERIQTAAANAHSEIVKISDSLRVELFLLAAHFEHKRRNELTRDDLLDRAEQLAQTLPETKVKVYLARAEYATGDRAIDYAKQAVKASEQVGFSVVKGQAQAKLSELLAHKNQQQPRQHVPLPGTGATDRVMGLLNEVHLALLDGRLEDSVNHAGKALEQASSPQLRRAVLRERAIALYEMGRLINAEADIDECISLLGPELAADNAMNAGALDRRRLEEEDLYLVKAFLKAKAGSDMEAWAFAEQGRAGGLKRELAGSSEFPANFDSIRPWLHSRRAAMLSFGSTRWGTLVLTAGPDDAEPRSQILEFSSRDLNHALNLDPDPENTKSDAVILDSIPALSTGLIHPLFRRLQEITQHASVLYIVPDSALYHAPFAALTLDTSERSSMLIDLCPLAVTPSAAVLRWCASRSVPSTARDCLAVAVGESEGTEFRDDLRQIAAAPWPKPPIELIDENATRARVTAEAPLYSVVYLSCHGTVAESTRDLMAASQLELAAGCRLSARDVLAWKMHADLVFLNACLGGRFRLEARSDVNGFVRAFMLAGARSLIAPLIRVEPRMAGELAASFFEVWLGGASKAQALRSAQLAARDKYPDKGWATFSLIWDFL